MPLLFKVAVSPLGAIALLLIWIVAAQLSSEFRRDPHWAASQRAFMKGDYATFNDEVARWKAIPLFCPLIVVCGVKS